MGITYKAIDTHLGCPVALKIINAARLSGATARERFLREARTAAQLRHVNIASVFHLGLGEENCYYAMEFIEGETLEAKVRRQGTIPYSVALSIVTQSARALRVAHAQNFIHRDIKPTNIMLVAGEHHSDNETLVKLIDFGLVKALSEEPGTEPDSQGYFAGTPHYASPEQLTSGTADPRSDIYSLGRCLMFMLTGTSPAPAIDSTTTAGLLRSPKPTLIDSTAPLPGPLIALLKAMTSENLKSRPQTADELLQMVRVCAERMRGIKQSFTENQSGRTFVRMSLEAHRWGWIGLAAVILALTLIMLSVWQTPWSTHKSLLGSSTTAPAAVEARVLYTQAEECSRKNEATENRRAIDLYSQAITKLPEYADAHAGLADAYLRNVDWFAAPAEQLELAAASVSRAIALSPRTPRPFATLGAIQNRKGKPWEALVQVHHALELDPRYPEAMRKFSMLWSTVGQPDLGLPWAIAATRIEPSSVVASVAAADASFDLSADDQAVHFFRHCLEINPLSMPGHCGLVHIHLLQGKFEQARQDCLLEEAIAPNAMIPLTLKAQIAFFSRDYAGAEPIFRRLVVMNRDGLVSFYSSIRYISALGFLRLQAGDSAEGNRLLEEASTMDLTGSEGPQAAYDLAAIRAIQNRREEALSLLQQSIISGWKDYRSPILDPRFGNLSADVRFQKMLVELQMHIARLRQRGEQLCAKQLDLADYPVRPPNRECRSTSSEQRSERR